MGREGVAISLVTGRDLFSVKRLFKEKGIQYVWDGKVPDMKRVGSKKGPGGAGRRFGGKPPGGGKKSRPPRRPRKKSSSTPKS
jgi:hypothetical protein